MMKVQKKEYRFLDKKESKNQKKKGKEKIRMMSKKIATANNN